MSTAVPNLFIVGAPKCATTSLHHYLGQHPQIFMSNPKELHHFCTDFILECDEYNGESNDFYPFRNRDDYLRVFDKSDGFRIVGESSVFYLYSREAAENIHAFNPSAKMLISIRDPVDFMVSMHRQMLRNPDLHETEGDFERALGLEAKRRAGRSLPSNVNAPSMFLYRPMARFDEQILRYLDVFSRDRIRILVFDDIRRDPLNVYRGVLEFLELDTDFEPDLAPVNVTRQPRFTSLNRLLTKFQLNRAVRALLPEAIYTSLHRRFWEENDTDLRSGFEAELREQFVPVVERLSDLTGRDLVSLWGY